MHVLDFILSSIVKSLLNIMISKWKDEYVDLKSIFFGE